MNTRLDMTYFWIMCTFTLLCVVSKVICGQHEVRLINHLLSNYNEHERPSSDDHSSLVVEFQITLRNIIKIDEKNQQITTNLWLNFYWNDYKLRWNASDYGNITEIRLPAEVLWKPDVLMYNSADPTFDGSYPVNMVVWSNGDVQQTPPGIFTSTCNINIRWFPFDMQSCKLMFGSWTYDGSMIDLRIKDNASEGSLDSYAQSAEWDLTEFPGERNVVMYECCPDTPYIDLSFYLRIKRRKLYYIINIIMPCMMLAALNIMTFLIPPDAGEKIAFCVTILLSLTVFLNMIAESLPASSDAIPLISLYSTSVMMLNAASVVFTVYVLNLHHRAPETHHMPQWVKTGLCKWLAALLRIDRPGYDLSCAGAASADHPPEYRSDSIQYSKLKPDRSTTSDQPTNNHCTSSRSPDLSPFEYLDRQHKVLVKAKVPELRAIGQELGWITMKLRDKHANDAVIADWKFAAIVIDRMCFWFFTFTTALASAVVIKIAYTN